MAVAPAIIEQAEVLARQTAVVIARPRRAEPENRTTTEHTTGILGQCALARSTAHHGLSTWIWGMLTSLIVHHPTEVDDDGSDNDECTRAVGRWWLTGRRFLNTKRGCIPLYNVSASFINRCSVADALANEYHQVQWVLRITQALTARIPAKIRSARFCCHETVASI